MCNCFRFEVKTNYLTGVATEVCRDCGKVKTIPGTLEAINRDIRSKNLAFRTKGKDEHPVPLMEKQTLWRIRGRLEK